jgi:hypothetical protein
MSNGNTNGFEVAIERSREPPRFGEMSCEHLRDLGMCDDAITQYFCRFRHG